MDLGLRGRMAVVGGAGYVWGAVLGAGIVVILTRWRVQRLSI